MDKNKLNLFGSTSDDEMDATQVCEPILENDTDSVYSDVQNEGDIINNAEPNSDSEESLDSCDEDNDSIYTTTSYLGKDRITLWNCVPCGDRDMKSIDTKLPGPIGEAKNANDELSCWKVFFTDCIIEKIVHYTNIKIRQVQSKFERSRDARETDIVEMNAYLGLLYLTGICQTNRQNIFDLWRNDGLGTEIFRLVMGVSRFLFLTRVLHFDDITDDNRQKRKNIDKLYCVREFFDTFLYNCRTNYNHSSYVTVDEVLANFRGRCSFAVYMPNKPGKRGLKIWTCSDAKTYYTSNLEIFVKTQPLGPYQVSNTTCDIVQRLVQNLENSERNITCDNYFTSVKLANELLEKGLTLVGTIRKSNKEIPSFLTMKIKGRSVNSFVSGFTDTCMLVAYKSKKDKVMVLLSTMHYDMINNLTEDSHTPEVISFFNATKSGVEMSDSLQRKYTVSRKANRWPIVVFYQCMNVAGVNSFIVFNHNNNKTISQRQFLTNLGRSLVAEHAKRRAYETNLPISFTSRICEVFSIPKLKSTKRIHQPNPNEEKEIREGRCYFCPSRKNRKTKSFCAECRRFVCREHTQIKCTECSNNQDSD